MPVIKHKSSQINMANARSLSRRWPVLCICASIFLLGLQRLAAQISPPGLSSTRVASWMALGLDQTFDTAKKWQSVSYLGFGFMSNPNGAYNFFEKPSMLIINEEVKRKLSNHISLTGALSYREQYLYNKKPPYHKIDPSVKKEFRIYGKITYSWNTTKIKWNLDLRPEFRTFYLPAFAADDTRKSLRARFKLKSTIPLAADLQHYLILSAESLFQNEMTRYVPAELSSEVNQLPRPVSLKNNWSGFSYDDSRFCIYYRYAPKYLPFYAEIGYMNNLAEKHPTYAMHHIGLDLIFKDIF